MDQGEMGGRCREESNIPPDTTQTHGYVRERGGHIERMEGGGKARDTEQEITKEGVEA